MRESSCWSLWSPRSIIVARPDCCSRCHWHLGPVLILYVVYLKIIISRVSKTKRKKKKTYPSGAGRWRLPVLFGPLFPSLWRRLTAALVAISRVVAVIPFLLHFASPVLRTCSLLFVNLNNRLKEKKKKKLLTLGSRCVCVSSPCYCSCRWRCYWRCCPSVRVVYLHIIISKGRK